MLASADGSAMFEMGNTKVLAAVFGPKPVEQRSQEDERRAIVRCEYAMATFSTGAKQSTCMIGLLHHLATLHASQSKAAKTHWILIASCLTLLPSFSIHAGERRRRGKADRRATEIGMAIRNTMEQTILTELLPRSQIDIYVQVCGCGVCCDLTTII